MTHQTKIISCYLTLTHNGNQVLIRFYHFLYCKLAQSNWLGSKVSPDSCLNIKLYLIQVIIFACCVINFNTLWLAVHQCKISWKLHLSWKVQHLKYWLTVTSAKHLQKICSRLNKVYSHEYQKQTFTYILPWI